MARWLFPLGLILILLGVTLAHREASVAELGTAAGSTRAPAWEVSPNPGGDDAAPTTPVPQTISGTGQYVQRH